jgi:hypothetical protein
MYVDYDNSVFRLGLLDEDAIPQVPISSGSCNTSLTSQDKGFIALGVVMFAIVIVVGILAFFFIRKLRSQQATLSRQHEEILHLLENRQAQFDVEETYPNNPPDTD